MPNPRSRRSAPLRFFLAALGHPVPWLALQFLLVFLVLHSGRRLEIEIVPDSQSYTEAAEARTLAEALSSHRTVGYPLFLKAIGHKTGGQVEGSHARHHSRVFRKIPTVHALVFMAAVLIFWASVRVFTGSPWLAFAMATPLPYSGVWALVRRVQPDFLAAALALVTVSAFLLLSCRPRRAALWAALTVALFLTYQVRPSYLFLVPLLAVMGPLFWAACREPRSRLWRFEVGLVAAGALPLLLFCGLRGVVVGDFGLVPFGGHNASGIAASLLDREVIRSLDRNKLLARRILAHRERLLLEPMPLGGDTLEWHGQHNTNVWRIAVPAAGERVRAARQRRRPDQPRPRAHRIEINQKLTELSLDVFRRKPLHYLQWVRDSLLYSLDRLLADPWIRWPAILIALSLPFSLLLGAGPASATQDPRDRERRRRLVAVAALGLGFFLAHALLVVLVDVPYERFIPGLSLLLPPVLCGALLELWRPP